jgi:exonuclease I
MPGEVSSGIRMVFVCYDTQTTGTYTALDQILQFGAIRTVDDLNVIDRVGVRCCLQAQVRRP